MQQVLSLPLANGSFSTHILRTCSHLVLCLFVCSSCWLALSKFHSSMIVDGTWRDDVCSTASSGALGAEFVLHLSSVALYFCMSATNWLPVVEAEHEEHEHEE